VFTLRGDGPGNVARPLLESLIKLPRQTCLVAFFDLRGFTAWAGKNPKRAQGGILAFEEAVREGFPTDGQSWLRLFIKGTGDGVMIVSQADWYQDDAKDGYCSTIKPGHAKDFLDACSKALEAARHSLTEYPLQLGCAIATGELDRVFLFGRLDYIGPAANDAAKLQQHARDEICLTDDFLRLLIRDGHEPADSSPMGWKLKRGAARSSRKRATARAAALPLVAGLALLYGIAVALRAWAGYEPGLIWSSALAWISVALFGTYTLVAMWSKDRRA
jgi:class 3 adenylate cyclase